jgi:hypothetical protein
MTQEQKPTGDIVSELRLLGQQLGTAIKALWEADETRNLRGEIHEGAMEAGRQIETAIKSVRDSQAAKGLGQQVKETVDKAKEADVAGEIKEGIVTGLKELNKQLDEFIGSWTGKPGEPPAPPTQPGTAA